MPYQTFIESFIDESLKKSRVFRVSPNLYIIRAEELNNQDEFFLTYQSYRINVYGPAKIININHVAPIFKKDTLFRLLDDERAAVERYNRFDLAQFGIDYEKDNIPEPERIALDIVLSQELIDQQTTYHQRKSFKQ